MGESRHPRSVRLLSQGGIVSKIIRPPGKRRAQSVIRANTSAGGRYISRPCALTRTSAAGSTASIQDRSSAEQATLRTWGSGGSNCSRRAMISGRSTDTQRTPGSAMRQKPVSRPLPRQTTVPPGCSARNSRITWSKHRARNGWVWAGLPKDRWYGWSMRSRSAIAHGSSIRPSGRRLAGPVVQGPQRRLRDPAQSCAIHLLVHELSRFAVGCGGLPRSAAGDTQSSALRPSRGIAQSSLTVHSRSTLPSVHQAPRVVCGLATIPISVRRPRSLPGCRTAVRPFPLRSAPRVRRLPAPPPAGRSSRR